jgi:hypothetical protein
MFNGDNSIASVSPRPRNANLVGEYDAKPITPVKPAIDDTNWIRPPPIHYYITPLPLSYNTINGDI